MTAMIELGPQYKRDDPFAARMRLHQSWYRAVALGVECGFNSSGNRYGNLLLPEDGRRGLNFLSEAIAALAFRSRAENPWGIRRDRLERNLLSSQPMCFNMFGPMAERGDLGASMLEALIDRRVSQVTSLAFEFAPQPKADYLNDATAFDVFIEYRTDDHRLEFLGVEVKLSEPFSPTRYALADRAAYQKWVDAPAAPWRREQRENLDAATHNQLWRDHMLAVALAQRQAGKYITGALMLIRHPADTKTASAVESYSKLLVDRNTTFIDMPLDQVVDRWVPVVAGAGNQQWLSEFDRRYVDLSGSEHLWRTGR